MPAVAVCRVGSIWHSQRLCSADALAQFGYLWRHRSLGVAEGVLQTSALTEQAEAEDSEQQHYSYSDDQPDSQHHGINLGHLRRCHRS